MTTEDIEKTIRKKINQILSQWGTMRLIAKKTGIAQSTMSNWKNIQNAALPNILDAIKIANILNISLYQLTGINDKGTLIESLLDSSIRRIVTAVEELGVRHLDIFVEIAEAVAKTDKSKQQEVLSILKSVSIAHAEKHPNPSSIPKKDDLA